MPHSSDDFNAKPAVLRCGRCGKAVDWDEAQLQVVCSCRPHIELPPVLVHEATDGERALVRDLFHRDFGRTRIIAFGEVLNVDEMPALVATMHEEVSGALAYRLLGDGLHIVALATDALWQRSGIGGHLVAEAELLARRLFLSRVVVTTTNDNLPALYFYQRRGYRLTALIAGSVLSGSAGALNGFAGIPVRDEVHLEKPIARFRPPLTFSVLCAAAVRGQDAREDHLESQVVRGICQAEAHSGFEIDIPAKRVIDDAKQLMALVVCGVHVADWPEVGVLLGGKRQTIGPLVGKPC
jgi:ribosomal protein S18 acetylase RimI-like enzyme